MLYVPGTGTELLSVVIQTVNYLRRISNVEVEVNPGTMRVIFCNKSTFCDSTI